MNPKKTPGSPRYSRSTAIDATLSSASQRCGHGVRQVRPAQFRPAGGDGRERLGEQQHPRRRVAHRLARRDDPGQVHAPLEGDDRRVPRRVQQVAHEPPRDRKPHAVTGNRHQRSLRPDW